MSRWYDWVAFGAGLGILVTLLVIAYREMRRGPEDVDNQR